MFNKVMIANRGEIAVRIIRACRELGVKTVMVYSKADADSMPVKMADEAVCIGAAAPSESYLLIERLLTVAAICDVDAIHPGYGFLSENPYFAEACSRHGIAFIGPTAEAMKALGDKAVARDTMKKAGIKADVKKEDDEENYIYHIKIPKKEMYKSDGNTQSGDSI